MKRFCAVLLSLGLIMAFSSSVLAVDAQFSGEYFLQGWYNKNASLIDKDSTVGPGNRGSSAFYTQRLRVEMDFKVARGLTLQTRFDALDRKWMAARRSVPENNGWRYTDNEAENIAFEIANVQFMTPIGYFLIGNQKATQFGTPFNDYVDFDNPLLVYYLAKGPWSMSLSAKKSQDGVAPPGTPIGGGTDFDSDSYTIQIQRRWSGGGAGFQFTDVVSKTGSAGAYGYKVVIPFSIMFIKQKFGKVFIEDEALWVWGGKYVEMINSSLSAYNQKNGLGLANYFNINVDLAPAKLGFMFVYSKGDDLSTPLKKEGNYLSTLGNNRSFNPCLILFNEDYLRWMGNGSRQPSGNPGVIIGNAGVGIQTYFDNVWFYQVYGDFKVSQKLSLGASLAYAYADEKPSAAYVDDKYGYELDFTMKYKIYDNLEYMIGAAYLFTGDYFKGTNANVKLSDNYLITHKLTLTF